MLKEIRKALEAQAGRSAWERGVITYAGMILDVIEERASYEGAEPADRAAFISYALNGAEVTDRAGRLDLFRSWTCASEGGCYLIYNADIAETLCTPSELKKTRNGERRPNSREDWIDVQARALFQACNRLLKIRTAVLADAVKAAAADLDNVKTETGAA
ncbi:MAG: hypothetical protein IJ680_05715 [Paludibacteraceae bacterium]|nr:hypothetical protein [Paludibacteraceae bacterium]